MPPSRRRVAHVPSWVDESITVTAQHANQADHQTHTTDNHNVFSTPPSASMRLGEDDTCDPSHLQSHYRRGTVMHALLPKDSHVVHSGSARRGRREPWPAASASGGGAVAEAAIVALEHAVGKQDDVLFYGNADRGGDTTALSSNGLGAYRAPDDPINAVSTYHTNCRTTVADIRGFFTTAAPPSVGSVDPYRHRTLEAGRVDDDAMMCVERIMAGSGGAHTQQSAGGKEAPLSTQDLMLQLAARGAIRESTLREFLNFKPTTSTLLLHPLLPANDDSVFGRGGCAHDDDGVGGRGGAAQEVFRKVEVRQDQQRPGGMRQPSSSRPSAPTNSTLSIHNNARALSHVAEAAQLVTLTTTPSVESTVVPLLSRRAHPNRGPASSKHHLHPAHNVDAGVDNAAQRDTTTLHAPMPTQTTRSMGANNTAVATAILLSSAVAGQQSLRSTNNQQFRRRWAGQYEVAAQEEEASFLNGVLQ